MENSGIFSQDHLFNGALSFFPRSSLSESSFQQSIAFLSKVFWQLGEHLGKVKGELEQISILAEFCAQVFFGNISNDVLIAYCNANMVLR